MKQKNRWKQILEWLDLRLIIVWSMFGIGLAGCDEKVENTNPPTTKQFEHVSYVSSPGSPIDILIDDFNSDGRQDLAVTLHGGNFSQIFTQDVHGVFSPGPRLDAVGFHPGDWLRWPGAERIYVAAAEGSGKLLNFRVSALSGIDVQSQVPAKMPRNINHFKWPDWGDSVVITPFEMGTLELLKSYDPVRGAYAEKVTLGLGEDPATIRRADRVSVADIDGDGMDELLFASRSTGEIFKIARPKAKKRPKPELLYKLDQGSPHQVLNFDVDQDGKMDLIVPQQTAPFQIVFLLNQGNGRFRQGQSAWSFPVQLGLRYGDIATDRDARSYLAVVGYGAIALYQVPMPWGETEPAPVKYIKIAKRGMSSDIILHDMNGDQWLDLVVGYGSSEHGVVIIHGPLWQNMDKLASEGFTVD